MQPQRWGASVSSHFGITIEAYLTQKETLKSFFPLNTV